MSFFNTIGVKAKAFGDSAKLNAKISGEKRKIISYKEKLGELAWIKFKEGIAFSDADILGLCNQIKTSYLQIDILKNGIEQIKARSVSENKEENSPEKGGTAPPIKSNCPKCGAEIPEGQRFCGLCGAIVSNGGSGQRLCGGCGFALRENQIFCPRCGQKCGF